MTKYQVRYTSDDGAPRRVSCMADDAAAALGLVLDEYDDVDPDQAVVVAPFGALREAATPKAAKPARKATKRRAKAKAKPKAKPAPKAPQRPRKAPPKATTAKAKAFAAGRSWDHTPAPRKAPSASAVAENATGLLSFLEANLNK
jgi:hypothetical protein